MKTSFFYTLLSLITILSSTIITIPEDCPTIQLGIDSAVDSDTILVYPGTYYEHIDYNGKSILIGSLFIIEHDTTYISQTIIDGYDSGTVVTFFNEEYSGAELSGFTIANGYADYLWNYNLGGGILIAGSSSGTTPIPELNNLIIRDNYAQKGSGMFLGKACPKLWKIKLINNYASQTGGGIQMNAESNPLMIEIEIRDNYAVWGGGLYCYDDSNPTLYRVLISNNEAVYEGGGVLCYIDCSPTFHNTTITQNSADTGSGIFCHTNSNPTLINSIVWNNYY
ncbi:MAG: right-handed parallel beta-helix repeat-containing protein [Candidatus Cloacimonetes bacterium]|nr:right-handed parallel beta-helix repeat-containing protein [Candidatus Cloacimonadota bacterium]